MLSESSREGMASSVSTSRMITASAQPPSVPATSPVRVPAARPTETATKAPSSDCRAPWTMRA